MIKFSLTDNYILIYAIYLPLYSSCIRPVLDNENYDLLIVYPSLMKVKQLMQH